MNSQHSCADPVALKRLVYSEVLWMIKSRLGIGGVGKLQVFYVHNQDSPFLNHISEIQRNKVIPC